MSRAAEIALQAIDAVEHRRLEELATLYHPEIAFHWPPGLPYSGDHSGSGIAAMSEAFSAVWTPLQPDAETRRMEPHVIAAGEESVVIDYIWRAKDAHGHSFETAVLSHYRISDGRLREARMFYYDLPGLIAFVENAYG